MDTQIGVLLGRYTDLCTTGDVAETDMTEFADQTVLVTGAGRGMGRHYVDQLLGRGVARVYAAARDPRAVEASDPRVVPLFLDVTDAASIARAAATATDVGVLINNAGIAEATSVLEPGAASLRRQLETNLFGPLALVGAFADQLAERSGAVLNVSSVMAWLPASGGYSVSKAAMWSATDVMRGELAPRGIQVSGLYMSFVDTDMSERLDRPKSDPADIVRAALDGLEGGELEILADEATRSVRAQLHRPIAERLAPRA
jgi:NAD(P)-dependent dehydrogenase (short-subunit alcohol dehydrogenase family)